MSTDKIKVMMARRKAALHTVNKSKFRMRGCPLGDFDAFMESPHSLPLVIRGEAGRFNSAGSWERSVR